MNEEFKDFLAREYRPLLEELLDLHECSFPNDQEMRDRVEKAEEELNYFLNK